MTALLLCQREGNGWVLIFHPHPNPPPSRERVIFFISPTPQPYPSPHIPMGINPHWMPARPTSRGRGSKRTTRRAQGERVDKSKVRSKKLRFRIKDRAGTCSVTGAGSYGDEY